MRRYITIFGMMCSLSVYAEPAGKPEAIRAMGDELSRQMKELSLPKLEKPYYMEYVFSDNRQIQVVGSFGALEDSVSTRDGFLRVGIRVGDTGFDQTGYLGFGGAISVTYPQRVSFFVGDIFLITAGSTIDAGPPAIH